MEEILVMDNFMNVLCVCPDLQTTSKLFAKPKSEIKYFCDHKLTDKINFRYLRDWSEVIPIDMSVVRKALEKKKNKRRVIYAEKQLS